MRKNISKMSSEELRNLADQKAKEENVPIKEGFLKDDLYEFVGGYYNRFYDISFNENFDHRFKFQMATKKEKKRMIDVFASRFKLALKKGTKFIYYSKGSWCDNTNYGLYNMGEEWAKEYLINIKNL